MKKKRLDDYTSSLCWRKKFLVMRLVYFLMVGFVVLVPTSVSAQNKMISLEIRSETLSSVLMKIKDQSGVNILYNENVLRDVPCKDMKLEKVTVEEALNRIFEGTRFGYEVSRGVIVIRERQAKEIIQKSVKVSGQVSDEKGEHLPGVTVLIKGTSIGAATDIDGKFTFSMPAGKHVLLFSMVGMESKEIVIDSNKEISEIVVVLKSAKNELEDVVVTGIFKKNKEAYTGAVTVITDKELKLSGNKNLLVSIGNIDPSFNILTNNEFGSDPNHLPEIQIRGAANLPTLEDLQDKTNTDLNTPLIILDGFEIDLQRMMDLNSDEVSSITLLKDGTATAIYGSRGANGVIVITTKEPEVGKLKLAYNGSLNIEVPDLDDYHLLNAKDKLDLELRMGYYSSSNVSRDFILKNKYAQRLEDVVRGVDTYWLSKPLRTGVGHRHSLRLEGGDKSFRYAASVQYNGVAGVMKKSDRNSFNAGINLSYYHEKVIFKNDLSIGVTKSKNSPYGSFADYTLLNPYWKPYDDEGKIVKLFDDDIEFYGGFSNLPKNPLYNATLNMKQTEEYTNIINNFSIEWKPFEGFIARGRAGISSQISESDNYKPAKHTDFESDEYNTGDGLFRKGRYVYTNGKMFNYELALTLSYAKTFAEKHWVYAGLNADLTSNKLRNYSFTVEGFLEEKLDFLASAIQYQKDGKPSGSEATTRRVGVVGNINYSYDNRYYVDFAFRVDGSSQFGSDKKFAPFYSVGVGWNVEREKFMSNVIFIDRLKIRGSFGQTGSQKFNAYQAKAVYCYYLNDRYHQWIGAYQKALENTKLEWQKTNKWNVGVDMDMLKSRLNIVADIYLEKTSNLLSSLDLPYSNGFTSYVENVGKKENRGFELKTTVFLVRDTEKKVIWSVTGSLVHNRDRVVKLSPALKEMYDKLLSEGGSLPNKILREGDSENTIYAVHSLGIDPSNGRELFLKKNGEVSYSWDANDRVACGVSEPKYRGNFSTLLRWRDFSMNVSFAYRFGGQLYNSTLVNKIENADKRFNVDKRVFKERWQNPGERTFFKGLKNESTTNATSRFVQDERTLTCQNIHLSYDWQNKEWLQKNLGIRTLTLSSDISDLFYKSSVKHERGLSYPFSRRFSFSLSMWF